MHTVSLECINDIESEASEKPNKKSESLQSRSEAQTRRIQSGHAQNLKTKTCKKENIIT